MALLLLPRATASSLSLAASLSASLPSILTWSSPVVSSRSDGRSIGSMRTRCTSSTCSRAVAICAPVSRTYAMTCSGTKRAVSSQMTVASSTSSMPGIMRFCAHPPNSSSAGTSSHNLRYSSRRTTAPSDPRPLIMPPAKSRRSAASFSVLRSSSPAASRNMYAAASRMPWRIVSAVTMGTSENRPSARRTLRRMMTASFPMDSAWCAMGCAASSTKS